MKRLRAVFVILALCLWLPLLGFALFSVRTVEADEAGRYQAVAERAFDEMERELSELLAREEARPVADYDFTAERGPTGTDAPFVLGYFERDALGILHQGVGKLETDQLASLLGDATTLVSSAESSAPVRQAAGSTLEIAPKGRASKQYDALSSLNRAAWSRGQSQRLRQNRDSTSDSGAPSGPGLTPIAPRPATLAPLRPRAANERQLLLLREVQRDGQGVVQGFVVGVPELLSWLSDRVLERAGLVRSATLTPLGREDGDGTFEHRYQHRFAEPFASQTAVLTLGTVAELEAGFSYYAISGLLLVFGALALLAGYRMAAAVVSFAERRNDFVSAVTHELKTPLTSIRMYGEMLRDGVATDTDKQQRYYRIITAESERLTRLIDNVLELARLERNQRALSLTIGDVTHVVRETLEVLEPHASELGFELHFDSEPNLPAVQFDRDALAQVLFNLVDNALKYSDEASERVVSIRCARQGQGVVLQVADRGPGVAPEHLRQIWQPFFRGERELTRKHKGTGIGLALVRGLVQRMGGQVTGRNTQPGFEVSVALGTS
jgi:signal transduction histidine kinase